MKSNNDNNGDHNANRNNINIDGRNIFSNKNDYITNNSNN